MRVCVCIRVYVYVCVFMRARAQSRNMSVDEYCPCAPQARRVPVRQPAGRLQAGRVQAGGHPAAGARVHLGLEVCTCVFVCVHVRTCICLCGCACMCVCVCVFCAWVRVPRGQGGLFLHLALLLQTLAPPALGLVASNTRTSGTCLLGRVCVVVHGCCCMSGLILSVRTSGTPGPGMTAGGATPGWARAGGGTPGSWRPGTPGPGGVYICVCVQMRVFVLM